MKIAIHSSKRSFSDGWIEYCEQNDIPFNIVNCYDSDIINQLKDCDALMWHHHHGEYKDVLFAKQLLHSMEQAGKKVFPDFRTNWHFDDKVGQKYLLEAIGVPIVPSFVFYSKSEAFEWINNTSFPKVFKLRGGAGSANVKLVNNRNQAKRLTSKAFSNGFSQYNRIEHLKDRFNQFRFGKKTFFDFLKGVGRLFIPIKHINFRHKEKGYVYFQDFIPNNNFDIRVIVIKDKAFAIKRLVRKNDFRASGSGTIIYNRNEIDIRCIQIAFNTSILLNSQCIAYDFVFDQHDNPLIIEISYGFSPSGYFDCPGYWDSQLVWHEGKFNPYGWMVDLVVNN